MVAENSHIDVFELTTILVVEDNPVERQVVSKMLRNSGFEVVAVDCGEAVLDTVISCQPDLILLDALLPDIDGFDVCVHLRAHPRGIYIPIIMLTGLDDVASINRAYEVGATDFFPKPINHTMLVHRIRYLLRARQTTDQLRLSRQSLASAQRIAGLGHWEYDVEKQRWSISEELYRLYGLDPADYDGSDINVFLRHVHPDDQSLVDQGMEAVLGKLQEHKLEHRILFDDGSCRYIEVHALMIRDQGDDHVRVLGTTVDVTERKAAEREILRLAYGDRLTGLPSRPLLEMYLEQAVPASHIRGNCLAIMGIDLDLFSRINNSMGHSAGDAILLQLSERLVADVGGVDLSAYLDRLSISPAPKIDDLSRRIMGRLAADTFIIIMSGVDRDGGEVEQLAQRILASFERPFVYRGQELFVTGSIGIAYSESGSSRAETLLQRADLAMHEAKTQGRNRVRAYSGELVSKVSAQLAIQSELRRALEGGEFQLFYQPKVSAADGTLRGFEALIRWIHPVKGMIPPDQFISIAEDTGQIVTIGQWVLNTACAQNKAWIDEGLSDVRVAVNVSARQIREGNLKEVVEVALAQSGLRAENLELEMTEGTLMSDPNSAAVIVGLKSLGISIALDDFGTGYSSLSYITRFPIDTIKIDRSFVKNITVGSQQAAIVSAVSNLSHGLNFNVVAEGVETEVELEVVRQLHCDEVQGYYYCRPMPAEDISAWLRNYSASSGNAVNQL